MLEIMAGESGGQESNRPVAPHSRREAAQAIAFGLGAAALVGCMGKDPTAEVKEPESTAAEGDPIPTSTAKKIPRPTEAVNPTATPEVKLEGSFGAGGPLHGEVIKRLDRGDFAGQQEVMKQWLAFFTDPRRGSTRYAAPTSEKVPFMLVYDQADPGGGEVVVGIQDMLDQKMMAFPPAKAWRYDNDGRFIGFASPDEVLESGYERMSSIPVDYGPLRVSKVRGVTSSEMVGGRLVFVDSKTGKVVEMMGQDGKLVVESKINPRPREWEPEWDKANSYDKKTWSKEILDLANRSVEAWIALPKDQKEQETKELLGFLNYIRIKEAVKVLGEATAREYLDRMSEEVTSTDGTKAPIVVEDQRGLLLLSAAEMTRKPEERRPVAVSSWEMEKMWNGDGPDELSSKRDQGTCGISGVKYSAGSWVDQASMGEFTLRKNVPSLDAVGIGFCGVDMDGNTVPLLLIWRDNNTCGIFPYRVVEKTEVLSSSCMVAGGDANGVFYGSAVGLVSGGFDIQRTTNMQGKPLENDYRSKLLEDWFGENLMVKTRVAPKIKVGTIYVNCEAAHENGAEYLSLLGCREKDKVTYPWEEQKVGWGDVWREGMKLVTALKKVATT